MTFQARYPSSRRSLGKPISKTPKTALVIVPPKRVWPAIQKIRKKHDCQFYRWMPHINLLYPFKPKSDFDWAQEELQRACAGFKPFEITLASFNYFRHGKKGHTLWLSPEPEKAVMDLQARIGEAFPECDDLNRFSSGFNPHLSVGQVKGREKTDRLLAELRDSWSPLRFRVSEIALIWRKDPPQDRFQIWEKVSLIN